MDLVPSGRGRKDAIATGGEPVFSQERYSESLANPVRCRYPDLFESVVGNASACGNIIQGEIAASWAEKLVEKLKLLAPELNPPDVLEEGSRAALVFKKRLVVGLFENLS
jgi:hypothetical protein